MRRIVPGDHSDAESREVHAPGRRGIATGHRHAATHEEFGERTHACAGDPDEVHGARIAGIE